LQEQDSIFKILDIHFEVLERWLEYASASVHIFNKMSSSYTENMSGACPVNEKASRARFILPRFDGMAALDMFVIARVLRIRMTTCGTMDSPFSKYADK
jgi:hypothetical protein